MSGNIILYDHPFHFERLRKEKIKIDIQYSYVWGSCTYRFIRNLNDMEDVYFEIK